MRMQSLSVLAGGLLGLCLAVGCEKKEEHAATPSASASAHATTTAAGMHSAAASAKAAEVAVASAAPSASASAAPGEVHQHVASVKQVSGKVDVAAAERRVKSKSGAIRTKCVKPAIDKKEEIDGSLKLVMETGTDGKVTKSTPTVTGKIPDDIVQCMQKYAEKELEFDTNDAKAKVEVVFDIGPNAKHLVEFLPMLVRVDADWLRQRLEPVRARGRFAGVLPPE